RNAEEGEGVIQRLARWDRLKVAEAFSEENQGYVGRAIKDIAEEQGRDAFDVFIDMALADGLRTSFMPTMAEDSEAIYAARAALIEDTRTVVGASDAGAHLDMIDSAMFTTRFLANAVRRHKTMTVEQAVRHVTHEPAKLVGLRER